jgi:hypothetical protein
MDMSLDLNDLDIGNSQAQLAGDNGQIYLFQWLAALEKSLREGAVVGLPCIS